MDKKILVEFGARVREARVKRQLSQEQLADMADVHRTYISMIERAEKNITLLNIEKIAKAFGISVAGLFGKNYVPNFGKTNRRILQTLRYSS